MSAPPLPRERIDAALREALDLAARGRGRVEPNPPVGAVVLDAAGRVVGRGFHEAYGDAHAEPNALRDAGDAARGGTLVVTLEPCAHTATTEKKTPRCVDAIRAAGIARVVAGCPDPNPATAGRARGELERAGIDYVHGGDDALADEARRRIARYARHLDADVPWTIAKWAMSCDGRVADAAGAARWISGDGARALVHAVRARVEAVVVGRGTVTRDDPDLTCRSEDAAGRTPAVRVVLDSRIRLPAYARVVTGAREVPTLLICTDEAPAVRRRLVASHGVDVEVVPAGPDGRVDPRAAFRALRDRGVRRVLLESGGTLTAAALRAGVVHQVMAFVAPVVLGGSTAPTPFGADGWPIAAAPRLEEPRVRAVGDDALIEGFWPASAAPSKSS